MSFCHDEALINPEIQCTRLGLAGLIYVKTSFEDYNFDSSKDFLILDITLCRFLAAYIKDSVQCTAFKCAYSKTFQSETKRKSHLHVLINYFKFLFSMYVYPLR